VSSSAHPAFLIAVSCVVAALIAIVIACRARGGFLAVFMSALALIFLLPVAYVVAAMNPSLIDGRFRTYKAFYKDIHEGMTREEVLALVDRHYPKSGKRKPPKVMSDEADSLGFFMNPESSREPNCEGIFLTLTNGLVTKKVYSPD
jgi:hypothetical protein